MAMRSLFTRAESPPAARMGGMNFPLSNTYVVWAPEVLIAAGAFLALLGYFLYRRYIRP